ncbi:MAG: hypothetical protein MJ200_04665 [Mycoplasmoidaceae bacterium]|nr:hypothetical protein [Mycoplasmoidaceae bacterium]
MILGAYYISQEEKGVKGEGTIFANPREAKRAYHLRQVNIHATVGISTNAYKDKGLPSNCILVTSMGKIMFNDILPATMAYINDGKDIDGVDKERIIPAGENARKVIEKCEPANPFTKKTLQKIVDSLYGQFEVDVTAKTMDAIKNIGFDFSTKSSVTISAFDLPSYDKKLKYFVGADATVAKLKKQFNKGLLTDDERYKRVIDL